MGQEHVTPYTRPQIGLHNIMALLIIGLFLFGLSLDTFDKEVPGAYTNMVRGDYINLHKIGGVLVVLLLLLRSLMRMLTPPPAFPASMGPGFVKAAHFGHKLLYLLMFVVPVSGMAMSMAAGRGINFYLFKISSPFEANKEIAGALHEVHEISSFVLAALVLGHVAVALYHQFVLKDNLLYRLSAKGK
jgi:cytochrome b561